MNNRLAYAKCYVTLLPAHNGRINKSNVLQGFEPLPERIKALFLRGILEFGARDTKTAELVTRTGLCALLVEINSPKLYHMRQETKRLLVEAIVDHIEKETLCKRMSHLLDDFAIDQLASGIITKITVDKDDLLQTLRKINKDNVLVDIELGEPQIRDNDIYIPYKRTRSKVDSDGSKVEETDKWWQSHTVPYDVIDSGNTPSWLTLDSI